MAANNRWDLIRR